MAVDFYPKEDLTIYPQYVSYQGENTKSVDTPRNPNYTTTSRKQISSVVISENYLTRSPPEHSVRYVEVPVIEEVVRTVPVKSIVEVEKIVPKYEIEYVDKVIEVPQVQFVDHIIEKNEIREVQREVLSPIKQIKKIPREVIKHVPKVEYVEVEKIVEVPGDIIRVPKPDSKPEIRVEMEEVPVAVAQKIEPVMYNSEIQEEIDVYQYEPHIVPIDIHVVTPISTKIEAVGATEVHEKVDLMAAHYNTILQQLNTHLDCYENVELPYVEENGIIPFLPPDEMSSYVALSGLDDEKTKKLFKVKQKENAHIPLISSLNLASESQQNNGVNVSQSKTFTEKCENTYFSAKAQEVCAKTSIPGVVGQEEYYCQIPYSKQDHYTATQYSPVVRETSLNHQVEAQQRADSRTLGLSPMHQDNAAPNINQLYPLQQLSPSMQNQSPLRLQQIQHPVASVQENLIFQQRGTLSGLQQERTLSNLQQNRSPSVLQQERTLSNLQQERSPSVLQQERTLSNLQQERSASVLQQERTLSNLQQDRSPSVLQQERTLSNLQQDRSPSVLQQERTLSNLQQERTLSNLQQERSPSVLQQERTLSTLQQERTPSILQQERTLSNLQQDRSPSVLQQERTLSNLQQERTGSSSQQERLQQERTPCNSQGQKSFNLLQEKINSGSQQQKTILIDDSSHYCRIPSVPQSFPQYKQEQEFGAYQQPVYATYKAASPNKLDVTQMPVRPVMHPNEQQTLESVHTPQLQPRNDQVYPEQSQAAYINQHSNQMYHIASQPIYVNPSQMYHTGPPHIPCYDMDPSASYMQHDHYHMSGPSPYYMKHIQPPYYANPYQHPSAVVYHPSSIHAAPAPVMIQPRLAKQSRKPSNKKDLCCSNRNRKSCRC